jgi:hypothetical protein
MLGVLARPAEAIAGDATRFRGLNMRLMDIDAPEIGMCYLPGNVSWGCLLAAGLSGASGWGLLDRDMV